MSIIALIPALAEILLFIAAAISVAYVIVFAVASRLAPRQVSCDTSAQPRFLIIIPAYAEDGVIVPTVEAALKQDYEAVSVCVVSDHMQAATNARLAEMPIELLTVHYADSTKGKAMQAAMAAAYDPNFHTHVLIIDADNIIQPDLLKRLAPLCTPGRTAIQLHRCAKNTDTPIAMLDAVSEEINNSIFRLGHNRLGLASALIGSGICFEARWLADAVRHLQSAGEDKELERQLLLDGHHTLYAADLPVFDEKVSNRDNFGRQRRRWLAAQFWALGFMLKGLPKAFAPHSPALRLDYLDKTLQQALIPRSLLMALTGSMAILTIVLALCGVVPWAVAIRWIVLDTSLDLAIILAIPNHMRNAKLLDAAAALPPLVWQMFLSLFHLRGASHKFLHTEHGQP